MAKKNGKCESNTTITLRKNNVLREAFYLPADLKVIAKHKKMLLCFNPNKIIHIIQNVTEGFISSIVTLYAYALNEILNVLFSLHDNDNQVHHKGTAEHCCIHTLCVF